jgi:ATP/ADP translocase
MAMQSTFLRSVALRVLLAALAVVLIEVIFPAAIAAQPGL